MTIQNVEPWRKYDCTYGKILIWSFTLEAGIGRVDVGCCWLLLIADGCYWLQLVAAGCWMIAGCGLDTAGCCWLLDDCCWLLECCLQAKKSLNIFGILMICGYDNFAGEKVFEYFQDIDALRLRQFCRRKSLWIFSSRWWGNLTKTSFGIVLEYFLVKEEELYQVSPEWWLKKNLQKGMEMEWNRIISKQKRKGRFLHIWSVSWKSDWILIDTDADEVRFDLWVTSILFPSKLVGVVQFKIHSCFRTGARQWNLHTLIPKLALVDTV